MNRQRPKSSSVKKTTSTSSSNVPHRASPLSSSLRTLAFHSSTPTMKPVPRTPVMRRANRSLLHGKHIMFGNHVAHSERKTRRTWLPNVQSKHLMSETLGRKFKLPVSTTALRNIDRAGGFDQYLLKTRNEYLGGEQSIGNRLKRHVREVQVLSEAIINAKKEARRVKLETIKEARQERAELIKQWEEEKPIRAERMKKFYEEQATNGEQWLADYELKKQLVEKYADRLDAGEKIIHTKEDGTEIQVPLKLKKPRLRKLRAIERAQAIVKGETPPPRYGQTEQDVRPHRKMGKRFFIDFSEYKAIKAEIKHMEYHLAARTEHTPAHVHAAKKGSKHSKRVPLQPWTYDRNILKSLKNNSTTTDESSTEQSPISPLVTAQAESSSQSASASV